MTESRSQKYLLAIYLPQQLNSCAAKHLSFESMDHGITGKERTLSKSLSDHNLSAYFILKPNCGLIRHCTGPHTHTHQRLAKLSRRASTALNSTRSQKMSNERGGCGQGTLSQSPAKVSAIIITVCTQSGCVLSYSLSQSSEETGEFGTDFPRGQDSPNIQYQHSSNPLIMFSLEGQDKTQARKERRHGNINGRCSDRAGVIFDH